MNPLADDRPPYVRFEMRAVEDRAASVATGHAMEKDVPYALITQLGARDTAEQVAAEWFTQMRQEVKNQRLPAKWLEAWEKMFDLWQKGEEMPTNGTPIKMFPVCRPSQIKMCLDMGVFTVEDLAALPSEAAGRLGIGGQTLVQKAKDWLESASDRGQLIERVNSAETRATQAEARMTAISATLEEMKTRLAAAEAFNLAKT